MYTGQQAEPLPAQYAQDSLLKATDGEAIAAKCAEDPQNSGHTDGPVVHHSVTLQMQKEHELPAEVFEQAGRTHTSRYHLCR